MPLQYGSTAAQRFSAAPAVGPAGATYYNTTNSTFYVSTGAAWVVLLTGTHAATHQPGGTDPMAVDAAAATGSLRTLGTGATQAAAGNDARFGAGGPPSGTASGDLTGTYPAPTIAALAVTDAKVAAANKDGAAGTASMRTLGTGAQQAAAGSHGHALTDANVTGVLPIAQVPTGTTSTTVALGSHGHVLTGAEITGTLPTSKGGTGTPNALVQGGVQYGVTTTAMGSSAAGSLGQLLVSGSSGAPTWAPADMTTLPTSWVKKSVLCATTANITLSGTQTIDGIGAVAGDRVLVKDQSTPAQNGIYTVAAGAWTRSTDADLSSEIAGGTTNVDMGTVNGGSVWTTMFSPTATLGTTPMVWSKVLVGTITQEELALGTFGQNLVLDPSFEEPYPIALELVPPHLTRWKYADIIGTGYAAKSTLLPYSGVKSLRLGVTASGHYVRVWSNIFPVTPGKTYVVSLAAAKEMDISVGSLTCRVAGGSTTALTEYPGGPSPEAYIAFTDTTMEAFDPAWIGNNLFPDDMTADANADGIADGLLGYVAGTVTAGARTVTTAGQVLSATSIATGTNRWGVTPVLTPISRGLEHRVVVKYTALGGTNARLRVYVDGYDQAAGTGPTTLFDQVQSAVGGTVTVPLPASANYDAYRLYVWIDSASGTTATNPTATVTRMVLERYDTATAVTVPDYEVYDPRAAEVVIPAGINYAALSISVTGATAAQAYHVDDVAMIEKGVTATEITAAGVRNFDTDGLEVGAMMAGRANYLNIRKGSNTVATIDQNGSASFQDMTIAGYDTDGDGLSDTGLEIYGTQFKAWLDAMPRGVVEWGGRYTPSGGTTTTNGIGIFELECAILTNRMYKICTSALRVKSTVVNDAAEIRILATYGTAWDDTSHPSSPLVASTAVLGRMPITTINNTSGEGMTLTKLWLPGAGGYEDYRFHWNVRLLMVVSRVGGTGTVSVDGSAADPIEFWVEDIGPAGASSNAGQDNDGGGSVVTPVPKTYTTTWTSTSATSYMGSGAKDSSQGESDMKQGYSSADGDSKSLWIFPSSMVSTLAGVTSDANIIKVRIYLYANHWYYNAGGTALIKRHNYTSAPASSPGMTTVVSSTGWPKPGGRWVDITNASGVKAALRGGTMRGIGVGPAGTTSQTYYGRFNKSGAKIEVTYKK